MDRKCAAASQTLVAESQQADTAFERVFANAFSGAEDALVGFATTGRLELRSLADTILADISRMTPSDHGAALQPAAG